MRNPLAGGAAAAWLLILLAAAPARSHEFTGRIAAETRLFVQSPAQDVQSGSTVSLVLEPEYYHEWSRGKQSILAVPFLRLDSGDPERTHFDIRELLYLYARRSWEIRAGVGKVFWGVTESQQLVDIVNQTDLVENLNQEEKLGQPMVNLTLIRNWGVVDLFALIGFRERTYAGEKGRLRPPVPVDTDQAGYESDAGNQHLDFAARYFHTLGNWDVGLSYFHGTSRDPDLSPGMNGDGQPVLVPFYPQIDQFGLDAQWITGGWLWKLEGLHRRGQGDPFFAAVGGFEYTLVGIFGSLSDLGLITEYNYDDRGQDAPTPFNNDLFAGVRWTPNDVQSTEVLAGGFVDLDTGATVLSLESARRLGDRYRLEVELQGFLGIPEGSPLYGARRDSHLRIELSRYF